MNQEKAQKPEISVAPMMDWTDRHCRYFLRLISPNALLYTEMITTGAILHGDADRHLRFNEAEHPVALQLGGSDAADLAKCAKIGAQYGYDEINLNCGCPSDRVQNGRFGACLMKEPDTVADCVAAMQNEVDIPVTIKCRIGIDEQDDFAFLDDFVGRIADKGCKTFIIHARKAWLQGLSPKENREKPPLIYDRVAAVKEKYPALRIILNGGVTTLEQIHNILSARHPETSIDVEGSSGYQLDPSAQALHDNGLRMDGVMIGREAYHNPYFLSEIEKHVFGNTKIKTRAEIALAMVDYARTQYKEFGTPVKSITRHILGLYHEQPRARLWRRTLSTLPYEDGADETVILKALETVEGSIRQAA